VIFAWISNTALSGAGCKRIAGSVTVATGRICGPWRPLVLYFER